MISNLSIWGVLILTPQGPEAEEECQLKFFKGVKDKKERLRQWCNMDEYQKFKFHKKVQKCVDNITSAPEGEVFKGLVAVPVDDGGEEEEEPLESLKESTVVCKEGVMKAVDEIERRNQEVNKKICDSKDLSDEKINKIFHCARFESVRVSKNSCNITCFIIFYYLYVLFCMLCVTGIHNRVLRQKKSVSKSSSKGSKTRGKGWANGATWMRTERLRSRRQSKNAWTRSHHLHEGRY